MQVAMLATREHAVNVHNNKRVMEPMKKQQQHSKMDGQDFRVAVQGYLSTFW